VSIPPEGTASPAHHASGLKWSEVMRGTLELEGAPRTASVEITIAVADVASFVADPVHPGVVTGSVHVEGLTANGGAPVGGGSFHLFLDEGVPGARAMRYTLPFHGSDGRPWILRGVKDVRGHRLIDFWRAATTLDSRLESGDDGGLAGVGRLRISAPGVAQLVGSMRPVRGGRRLGPVLALWQFLRFYGRTLLRLYVAGKRGRRS
jgi:cholesterol oxidase